MDIIERTYWSGQDNLANSPQKLRCKTATKNGVHGNEKIKLEKVKAIADNTRTIYK